MTMTTCGLISFGVNAVYTSLWCVDRRFSAIPATHDMDLLQAGV